MCNDKDIIPFEPYNTPGHAKIGTNDVRLQYKIPHFQMSEKPEMANLINVIY